MTVWRQASQHCGAACGTQLAAAARLQLLFERLAADGQLDHPSLEGRMTSMEPLCLSRGASLDSVRRRTTTLAKSGRASGSCTNCIPINHSLSLSSGSRDLGILPPATSYSRTLGSCTGLSTLLHRSLRRTSSGTGNKQAAARHGPPDAQQVQSLCWHHCGSMTDWCEMGGGCPSGLRCAQMAQAVMQLAPPPHFPDQAAAEQAQAA